MQSKNSRSFRTRREVEQYFTGTTIKCLLCGQRFRRLGSHLSWKHNMSANDYRIQFGLPWTRGLTSAPSRLASGWSHERKAKARKLAQKSQFFRLAHLTPRREVVPFLKVEAVKNLGSHAIGLGKAFEQRVRALFHKGFTDATIAQELHVDRSTVTRRTTFWRRPKRKTKEKKKARVAVADQRRGSSREALNSD